jgi:glycosyltransferase involved in cell wall biosynthesis
MAKALAIIDFYPASRGGHFREWPSIIARSASEHFDVVGIYVSGLDSMPTELSEEVLLNSETADTVLFDIDSIVASNSLPQAASLLNARKTDVIAEHLIHFTGADEVYLFIMWAFDLLDHSGCFCKWPWVGIGVQSAYLRSVHSDSYTVEAALNAYVEEDYHCRGLILWDKFAAAASGSRKMLYVPDKVEAPIKVPHNVDNNKELMVGIVGLLYGYRGVDFAARLALNNRSVKFRFAGPAKMESWSAETREFISTCRANLIDQWLTNQQIIELLMSLDALILDARNYPPPSAIALRALSLGRCLVVTEGSSWLNDIIRENGCGIIVNGDSNNLKEQIEEFYKTGGSAKCISVAKRLRCPELLTQSLESVWQALCSSTPINKEYLY